MTHIYYEPHKNESRMNIDNLSSKIPSKILDSFYSLPKEFAINNNLRVCHFFSQIMHESGNFRWTSENLNYSSIALKKVFSKYFPDELAEEYARNPEKIASRVYANRMGNGDEESKDGWKYRGRGFIQLTGKNNYTSFGNAINESVESTPDLVSTPKYALWSAGWFWKANGLNELADNGDSYDVVKQVTKRINGGYHGLDNRYERFVELNSLLS